MSVQFVGAPHADQKIPRGLLIGAGALVIGTLLMVITARLTGYQPARPPVSSVVESRQFRFADREDGAVLVFDPADETLVYTVEPGTNGFIRGVLRGLARDRRADHVGSEPPFRLTRWANGRLSLDDDSTGRHIDLEVFGPTNAGAFAQILTASGRPKDTP